ncbi:cytochrome-c oxidase, cbb3-type subunit III [Roseovarius salinarum]|uniref:cytochrome-c oxidase, cbb3-type subunit III n=1 Tax=Roseovarius salinarum TaxID=1981892 RepID=UPI000C335FA6|nr:cytochrome-c oxidase, cbb3-type subunit III [Roseovarius salinarum]
MAKQPKQQKQEPSTTGHEWDGIQEYNNPLPRWWVWIFYATIVWGIWYTIAYPAWPMIEEATSGYKGWSTRANVAQEIKAAEEANAEINAKLVNAELSKIPQDPELMAYSRSAGEAVFETWCAQCHGSGAAGFKGYPNLLDNAWLWGGTLEDIHYTISHGIRNEDDADARFSEMPAFGEILPEDQIEQVVNYVMSMSPAYEPKDASLVEAGAEVYDINCAACHGPEGKGMESMGAPNLTDAIWLYGGDYAAVKDTVMNSRYGVMPPWQDRLEEYEIRAVATYVHQLGGGQ